MLGAHAIDVGPVGMLAINIALLSLVGWALLRAERGLPDGREWTLLAMLAIFGIFGRVLLEPLPNIQPVTVLVLVVGMQMGAKRAIALATVIALGSNLIMGHGIWTLYQALGWSLVGCLGAYVAPHLTSMPRIAGTAAVCGVLFDWVISLSILHTLGPAMLPTYILAGIPYDMLHALGNLFFAAWLASPLAEMMERHQTVHLEATENVPVTA
jgi:energy-coupling factor transport system substrate-specific component